MFFNQGTRQPEASKPEKVNGDMASVWEELDDVQLATVVGGTKKVQPLGEKIAREYAERAAAAEGIKIPDLIVIGGMKKDYRLIIDKGIQKNKIEI